MLRILTIVIFLAAAAWAGWWIVGSRLIDRGVAAGIDSARADGWQIALDDLSVSGFPNRFDTRATNVDLATPDRLWGVALPFVQAFALSYRPNHLIVVPAPEAKVTTPFGPASVTAGDLRASAAITTSGGGLSAATIVGQGVAVNGNTWQATLASGQIALREAGPEAYDLALDIAELALTGLNADPRLPDRLTAANIDMTVELDRPATAGGRLSAATLRRLEVTWDATRIDLTGTIRIDPSGLPEGDLSLAITGWRELLTLAPALGLPPGQMLLLAGGLGGLDTDGTATVPLTLRGGQVMFGTIPLAPLPRLPAPNTP